MSQIEQNINTFITGVDNIATLLGHDINVGLAYANKGIDYTFKVLKDTLNGIETFTSIVKHGDTVIEVLVDTSFNKILTKSTEFVTGISAVSLCSEVPALAGLGGLSLTFGIPILDKGFNISGFLKEDYRDFMTDVETGFADEEIMRGYKQITNSSDYTAENQFNVIRHISDTYQNLTLNEILFSWNKFWDRAVGVQWEIAYNQDGKARLQNVDGEIVTAAMRDGEGNLQICHIPKCSKDIININIDATTNDFVVTYSDGYIGNIPPGNYETDSVIIYGDEANNILTGNSANNYIYGMEGNDRISGGLGNDNLSGNEGDDMMYGGKGDDSLFGDDGNDTLMGEDGYDNLAGGKGDDILAGGYESDQYNFYLGDGKDTIILNAGETGNDKIVFGAGITSENVYFKRENLKAA